jgi:hypothetical protein
MNKYIVAAWLSAPLCLIAVGPAQANGAGDCSAHIREMDALCEMQRRGEAPAHPSACLPEHPPGGASYERARREN